MLKPETMMLKCGNYLNSVSVLVSVNWQKKVKLKYKQMNVEVFLGL
jgi:hypothetical protein